MKNGKGTLKKAYLYISRNEHALKEKIDDSLLTVLSEEYVHSAAALNERRRCAVDALEKNLVDEMLLTEVQAEINADVFFPEFEKSEWHSTELIRHGKDEKHNFSFIVKRYTKI